MFNVYPCILKIPNKNYIPVVGLIYRICMLKLYSIYISYGITVQNNIQNYVSILGLKIVIYLLFC